MLSNISLQYIQFIDELYKNINVNDIIFYCEKEALNFMVGLQNTSKEKIEFIDKGYTHKFNKSGFNKRFFDYFLISNYGNKKLIYERLKNYTKKDFLSTIGGFWETSFMIPEIKQDLINNMCDKNAYMKIKTCVYKNKELFETSIPSWTTLDVNEIYKVMNNKVGYLYIFLKSLNLQNLEFKSDSHNYIIFFYPNNTKKEFDNNILKKSNINSGETGYISEPYFEYYTNIFRTEEASKVALHELGHHLGIGNIYIHSVFPNVYNTHGVPYNKLLISESIVELIALLSNICLIDKISLEQIKKYITYELKHCLLQIAKLLYYSKFKTFDEFISISDIKMIQETPALEYYIIKTMFLWRCDDFFEIFLKTNKIKEPLSKIIDDCNNDQKFKNIINKILNYLYQNEKSSQTEYYRYIYKCARMTIISDAM